MATPALVAPTINPQRDIGAGKLGDLLLPVQIGTPTIGTPASAAAAGVAGQVCFDGSYIYCCTATNTWLRGAIATW